MNRSATGAYICSGLNKTQVQGFYAEVSPARSRRNNNWPLVSRRNVYENSHIYSEHPIPPILKNHHTENMEQQVAFVNEYIPQKDREHYRLDAFEKRFFSSNPQNSWVIDRDRAIFLRVIKPEARKQEPGDPDARFEDDFHFHWKGFDYLVSTRCGLSENNMLALPGEMFESNLLSAHSGRILRFYIRHIGELTKPTATAPSALIHQRETVFTDLESALGVSRGGSCILSPETVDAPCFAKLKIAPNAEVTA